MVGKGDMRRASQVSMQISDLRYELAFGNESEKVIARLKLIELGDIKTDIDDVAGDENRDA